MGKLCYLCVIHCEVRTTEMSDQLTAVYAPPPISGDIGEFNYYSTR
jgi:hypothetical protein